MSFELATLELKSVVKSEQKRQADNGKLRESINHISAVLFVCLIDLILYVPTTIFQLNRDESSWVEPVRN